MLHRIGKAQQYIEKNMTYVNLILESVVDLRRALAEAPMLEASNILAKVAICEDVYSDLGRQLRSKSDTYVTILKRFPGNPYLRPTAYMRNRDENNNFEETRPFPNAWN